MKSSIRIDFADLFGKGIEPVIRVNIICSDDPRDSLLKTLFQSVKGESYLQFHYTSHIHTAHDGLPDMDKSLVIYKPKPTPEDFKYWDDEYNQIKSIIEKKSGKEAFAFLQKVIECYEKRKEEIIKNG